MRRRAPSPPTAKVRRSPWLVSYWRDGKLVLENFASGRQVPTGVLGAQILDCCGDWRSVDGLSRHWSDLPAPLMKRAINGLVRQTLLERSDKPTPEHRDLTQWDPWNPAAGFFHFGTRNLRYVSDAGAADRFLRRQARAEPMPRATKSYGRGIALPEGGSVSLPLDHVLASRRTWRRFGRRAMPLGQLATLLRLTWGVQHRVAIRGQGQIVLKTSPSGGAQHPGEVYVVALKVDGLARGVYHYNADMHRLVRLKTSGRHLTIARYLPQQRWYNGASALMVMTAVIAREMWKYKSPRAYRALLIDAGHLCQTFCLVATALELAPFCSMALADDDVEHDLGIDGVSETVLYCAGVGTRPRQGGSS